MAEVVRRALRSSRRDACRGLCRVRPSAPGIVAVALNTSHPDRVADNVEMVLKESRNGFWASMKEEGLIAEDYPYLG